MPTPLINTPRTDRTPPRSGFTTVPPAPLQSAGWSLPEAAVRAAVADRYASLGYVVVHVPGSSPVAADLGVLADALGLGSVFTPPLYATSPHTAGGVSRLTATGVGSGAGHPFEGRAGQRVHCDGTLQDLGQIPTTVMLCAAAAAEGGHSFLVDLPAAFAVLRERDPEAAAQLVHPGALVRTSTLVQGRSRSGPAFAPDGDGGWVTRFSRTATDTYHPLSGGGAALGRALEFLDEAAAEGSRFRAGFTLAAGQALVLANDRLGHGRTAYRDDPDVPRLLLRGLFTRRPAPVAVGGRTS